MEKVLSKKRLQIPQVVAALKHRNFRLFWGGQCISLIGTWMQNVAQSWLVLELTRSAFWLGVVSTFQFLPMTLFSLYAGTLIDRFPKKKMLIFTQAGLMTLAFILAVDTWMHTVKLWHVLILAVLLGVMNTFDMPARQAFMIELVGEADLMNAIVLNSSIFNAARVVGPSVSGLVIAKLGIALCFLINAVSFLPVITGIWLIRLPKPVQPASRRCQEGIWQGIKAGLDFVRKTPGIFVPLALLAVINVFAFNFNVLVPLYAKNVFHAGAKTYGFLMGANGFGAIIGSVILAIRSAHGPKMRSLFIAAAGVSIFELLLVPAKSYTLAYLLLGITGLWVITFTTNCNSLLQVQSPPNMRGRVMSIYTLVFGGLVPLGSFLSGSMAHAWGAPAALGLGALISLAFTVALVIWRPSLLKQEISFKWQD
ncbi:MFS transporter [Thermincola potens]|uniref:Major facilitator superfamily MFS_1 n=1 Tax=Thermincola potens (strain JR) TaxID=635013 RepID=D5XB82_THEPJ|nr:MFS transporter [Thermincola potens]ADG81402.1 major facilitator superfamily MFS_1 [Thermincola potens JR]